MSQAVTITNAAYATISAAGASAAVARGTGNAFLFAIVASAVTTGATFNIEGRRSGALGGASTSYEPLKTFSIAANGTYAIVADPVRYDAESGNIYDDFRVNCTNYTDGSYVVTSQKNS